MFTRGCLLGLLLVPATWLVAAWLALALSGPPEPVAGSGHAEAAAQQRSATATDGTPRSSKVVRPDSSAAQSALRRSGSLRQCTEFLVEIVLTSASGDPEIRRHSACTRMVAQWARYATSQAVALLGPIGHWARFHTISGDRDDCSDRSLG